MADAPFGVGDEAVVLQNSVEQPSPDAAEEMLDIPSIARAGRVHQDRLLLDADKVGEVAGEVEGIARAHAGEEAGFIREVIGLDEDLLVFDAGDLSLLSGQEETHMRRAAFL